MINFAGISDNAAEITTLKRSLNPRGVQWKILSAMENLPNQLIYESVEELKFELQLREAIVQSAVGLYNSSMGFSVFRRSTCNTRFWNRLPNGGFMLLPNAKPSDAIQDIYQNGYLYGTECATAIVIIYYKALLKVYGPSRFNKIFPQIYLMNWHSLDRNLAQSGTLVNTSYYLPGDRRYFSNPDVSPQTPQLQGENTIQLVNNMHYAHGLGIAQADQILSLLDQSRRNNATRNAYLRETVGRLDVKLLYRLQ